MENRGTKFKRNVGQVLICWLILRRLLERRDCFSRLPGGVWFASRYVFRSRLLSLSPSCWLGFVVDLFAWSWAEFWVYFLRKSQSFPWLFSSDFDGWMWRNLRLRGNKSEFGLKMRSLAWRACGNACPIKNWLKVYQNQKKNQKEE